MPAEQENPGHPQVSLGAGWTVGEPWTARAPVAQAPVLGQTAWQGYPGCQLAHVSWGALDPTTSVRSVPPTPPMAQGTVGTAPPAPGPSATASSLPLGSTQDTLKVRAP